MGTEIETDRTLGQLAAIALDPDVFRRLGYQAVDLAADYLAQLPQRPVFRPMTPDERRDLVELPLPKQGMAPEAILTQFAAQVMPHPMGNGHPRFFGWVNSPPGPLGALAEFLAAVMNPSCAGGDHAAIYLEHAVVRWLMELVGFPHEGSMGLLVSGGSMASLTCLTAARQWASRRGDWNARERGIWGQPAQPVLYLAADGHTTIRKAAQLLGLGDAAVRIIPNNERFAMDVAALRVAIAADRASGKLPFCVVASAGTAATGAVDDFVAIADICDAEELWFHIDGAYGAVGVLDPEFEPRFAGLERADSLAIDPHKWLSVPAECGCALVRDAQLLRETFSLVPSYVRTEQDKGFGGLPWFSEFGFQQTRGFRALKLWMLLQQLGREGVSAHVTRCNRLARRLAQLVESARELELLAPVSLSIVCFRYVPDGWHKDDRRLDSLNKRVMHEVQAGGEAFLTNAELDGHFALRACVLHYATTEADLVALLDVVRGTGARLTMAA